MPLQREFLGWDQPALNSATDYLLEKYRSPAFVDLTDVTVVLHSRRAGRRLGELLIQIANERQLGLFPPRITSIGSLPELLYEGQRTFAAPLVQQLAWAQVLRQAKRATIKKVMPKSPTEPDDPRWLELGALLHRQHRELASHRLDFAGVAREGRRLSGFTDGARWNALAKLQTSYHALLDGLELWDRQSARNFAVDHRECHFDGDLILLGTVDLSLTVREMLVQIAGHVTALVFAPTAWSDRFDAFGCIESDVWQTEPLRVDDDQILLADGPANQADAAIYAIESLDAQYGPDQITIGVPDPSLVPHLENRCKQFQLPARWGWGRRLGASRPVLWLRIVADYLSQNRFADLAELARHCDTQCYLSAASDAPDMITELDRYFAKRLPDYASSVAGHPGQTPTAVALLRTLLQPLTGSPRTPADWGRSITDVLLKVYGDRQLNPHDARDRALLEACGKITDAIGRLDQLPAQLAPHVSAAGAIFMLLGQLDDEEITAPAEEAVIEMIGWLDLPLDDAPAVIVMSMNDGIVPQTVTSDLLLPNRLRQQLGLDDNERRYARDAYALQTLLASRQAVRLIVGQRGAGGDPLRPSRLLMAVDQEELPQRCLKLFDGPTHCASIEMPISCQVAAFEVPPPQPLVQPIDALSVSDFGRYLACPYRFYLRKVLRLKAVDDVAEELDATTFGDLTHGVLEDFATGEFRDSSNADEIRWQLQERLKHRVKLQFGRHPSPVVQVQAAQLQLRLDAFADQQAMWRQKGWQITDYIERELPGGSVSFLVDGQTMQVTGRIDRIDYHPERNEHAVLDYKSGDAGDSPDRKHLPRRKHRETITADHWSDLQLPLYRHLASAFDLPGTIRLGYVLLPSAPASTRFHLAEWSDEDLMEADEAARNVVRKIRQEVFWPPTEPAPYPHDEFAAICQTGIFGRQIRKEVRT